MKIPKKCFLNRLLKSAWVPWNSRGFWKYKRKSTLQIYWNLRILQKKNPPLSHCCPLIRPYCGLIAWGDGIGGESPLDCHHSKISGFSDIWGIFWSPQTTSQLKSSLSIYPIYRSYTMPLRWYKIGQPSNTMYGWFLQKPRNCWLVTDLWKFTISTSFSGLTLVSELERSIDLVFESTTCRDE